MHDFFCTDSSKMYYPILANRVWYFKENEKGVATMCRAMEKMRDETAAEQNIKTLLVSVKNLMKNMNLSQNRLWMPWGFLRMTVRCYCKEFDALLIELYP